jgi:dTDP-4-dehydrorhamnose reductase
MARILVTGKSGQVGFELCRALAPLGEVVALDEHELNLASPDAIRGKVREVRPQVIVNAAAYTAVDRAESEPQVAMEVNAIAPGVLAEEAQRLGAMMVHYSTDYVFDGTKDRPYVENDAPNPLGIYGRSKLAGDQAIQATDALYFIFRTSWVYAARGHNFLRTMLRLGGERHELRIVDDQVGAPTWARFVANATARVLGESLRDGNLAREKRGLYNLTASGATSWFGFAQAIFAEVRRIIPDTKVPELIASTTADYPLPARRPLNSRLDNSKAVRTFGLNPPPWDTMLRDCLSELRADLLGPRQ